MEADKLTKRDIAKIFGLIKAEFPKFCEGMTDREKEVKIDLWFDCLCEYPKEVVLKALRQALTESEFEPRIAVIAKQAKKIMTANAPTTVDLWNEVESVLPRLNRLKAQMQYGDYKPDGIHTQSELANNELNAIWETLPNVTRRYFGSVNPLLRLCDMDEEGRAYERAGYLRYLPELKESEAYRAVLDGLNGVGELKTNVTEKFLR